jgi:lipopolysaccharide export system permease protein
VFGSILTRMILWELFKVFLIALVGITGILLMAGIIQEAAQHGLKPSQIFAVIWLLIPSTLPYTIPATTLFAACVVYGRLGADNEILAIKSAGVNVLHVVKPGIVLGLAMSAATMGLYYRIIPYTHLLLRELPLKDPEEWLYTALSLNGEVKVPQQPFAIVVRQVQGKKLIDPVFRKRNLKTNSLELVAQSREAELRVDTAHNVLYVRMHNGEFTATEGSRGFFVDKIFEVELPTSLTEKDPRARDMTWREILEKREKYRASAAAASAELERAAEERRLPVPPPDLDEREKHLKARVAEDLRQILVLDVELLMRPSLSLGCLCFIVVGCPVGIWFSRSDYLSSFITCFLPIVFVYYPLLLCGTSMAKEGRFDPAVMVWGADALMGLVGLGLFWRLMKN